MLNRFLKKKLKNALRHKINTYVLIFDRPVLFVRRSQTHLLNGCSDDYEVIIYAIKFGHL
jgi:hypothetical protein